MPNKRTLAWPALFLYLNSTVRVFVKNVLIIFFSFISFHLLATHIVGGELIYDFLGKDAAGRDIYRITLKVYRDCNSPNNAAFDGTGSSGAPPAYLTILGNGRDTVIDIGSPVITNVPPSINSPCIETPYVCVQEGIYTYTIALEPAAGGYYLIYQRCCRNHTILNLTDPGVQGSVYYEHIPGPEEVSGNSSPRFKQFPPLFLCNDLPFYFDHSATDPDGDVLVYSLATSLNGLDACCPSLFTNAQGSSQCPNPPPQCPNIAPPPPYQSVNYISPFSPSYPVASNPSISIDPITGKLTGKPNMLGQFVVCMEVREYREGVLIGTHFREFQFNIASCQVNVLTDMADQVYRCIGNVITFTNQSVSNMGFLTYLWDFGVPALLNDTSNIEHPTYTYQDTGKYMVTLIGNPGKICSDTIRKEFYVYPPLDVKFPPNPMQCFKNNSFDFKLEGTYLTQCKFEWEFGARATPSISTDRDPKNIRYDTSGRFFVTLKARQLTCRDSFIDTIRVIPRPRARILSPPAEGCPPVVFTFSNGSTAQEKMRYAWTFSNGKKSTFPDPVQTFTAPNVYSASLTVITTGVCKDTSTTSARIVTVHPLPVAGFSLYPRITSIFDPIITVNSTAAPGLSYDYSFGDGSHTYYHNAEHLYYDYGNYTITQIVTTPHGCVDSTRDIVQILPEHRFWIPDAFTPNQDSRNDVFGPIATGIIDYEMQIFNRWGDLLYKTTSVLEGWNGTFHGEVCKQDVYVWKIRYKDVVKNESYDLNGHVTLVASP
jgi:gliding motility-associated-like protein